VNKVSPFHSVCHILCVQTPPPPQGLNYQGSHVLFFVPPSPPLVRHVLLSAPPPALCAMCCVCCAPCSQVDMVSPLTQCQITFPVHLDRPTAREQLWWLNSACKLLETRLLQVGGVVGGMHLGVGREEIPMC
jgi:hypothetical protein